MALTASVFPNDMVKGRGRIEVILGPMFSGKTTELIRRITRYQFAKMKCLVLKYANDVRYSKTEVATHDSRTLSAISCITLQEIKSKAIDYDVLGIDEGQFFPDILNFCEELANKGKIIVVAALDGTYQRIGFGDILNLVPLAESIIKLHAVCMRCCGNASFTKRITNEKAVEIIGGADKYMSVCRECYHLPEPSRKRSMNDDKVSPLKELNENVPSPKKAKNIVNFCDKGTSPLKEINGVVLMSPLKIVNGVGSPFKKLNGVAATSPKKVKKILDLDENGKASPLKKIHQEMASPMKVVMALSL